MDIKIKDFEGPLDLLLHLVSKYQMDIYEVPLIEVIEQYLAYLATLQAMKLEVAGEYMLMASQLTLIKSRRLLPKVAEEMDEAEDLEQDPPFSIGRVPYLQAIRRVDGLAARGARPLLFETEDGIGL